MEYKNGMLMNVCISMPTLDSGVNKLFMGVVTIKNIGDKYADIVFLDEKSKVSIYYLDTHNCGIVDVKGKRVGSFLGEYDPDEND